MILDMKNITTAYRCSECGDTVFGVTGAVALTGDLIKLKCGCGESAMTIKNIADGKVRVTVPCAFCQSDHTFVISKKLLLSKELFYLSCSFRTAVLQRKLPSVHRNDLGFLRIFFKVERVTVTISSQSF